MKVAKFLFWLGIVVIVAELLGDAMVMSRIVRQNSTLLMNLGAIIGNVGNAFVGGGTLIGLSKIIERLYRKE